MIILQGIISFHILLYNYWPFWGRYIDLSTWGQLIITSHFPHHHISET